MGVEWGSKVSPLDLLRRGINHVPVKKHTGRGQKKRCTKEGQRRKERWKRAVFVHGRFIAVASWSDEKGGCWERKQPSRASHKYWYRTYLNVYAFLAPSLFLETSRRRLPDHQSLLLSLSLFSLATNTSFSSAQCDLPELIRHCHANSTRRFESRGISLTRLHVRGELTRFVLHLVLSVSSPQRWLN